MLLSDVLAIRLEEEEARQLALSRALAARLLSLERIKRRQRKPQPTRITQTLWLPWLTGNPGPFDIRIPTKDAEDERKKREGDSGG